MTNNNIYVFKKKFFLKYPYPLPLKKTLQSDAGVFWALLVKEGLSHGNAKAANSIPAATLFPFLLPSSRDTDRDRQVCTVLLRATEREPSHVLLQVIHAEMILTLKLLWKKRGEKTNFLLSTQLHSDNLDRLSPEENINVLFFSKG